MVKDAESEAKALANRSKRLSQREEANIRKATFGLLETAEGRDFLWWLLRIGKWGTQPYAGGESPLATAFNCGELNVGQQVFDRILEVEPAGFLRMQEDRLNAERERNDTALTGADTDSGPNSGTDADG